MITNYKIFECREIWDSLSKDQKIKFISSFPKIKEFDYESIAEQPYGTLEYYLMSNKNVIEKKIKEQK